MYMHEIMEGDRFFHNYEEAIPTDVIGAKHPTVKKRKVIRMLSFFNAGCVWVYEVEGSNEPPRTCPDEYLRRWITGKCE